MAKKIKKSMFSINSIGSKKKKEAENIIKHRLNARTDMLIEICHVLSWVLRNDYCYGKNRIEKFIERFFENESDLKMGDLFSVDDIRKQLKEEIDLNVDDLIRNHASKHYERVQKKVG